MDQELIAYLDERFRETFQQIASFREETVQRFERVETAIRHTQVEVEGLRDEIHLLAEGHMSIDENLGRFRSEVAKEFEETRGSIKVPYMDLDGRVQSLEAWRERRDQTDPMDLIRERYGKRT